VGHFDSTPTHFIGLQKPAPTLRLPDHKALPIMGALFASLIGLPGRAVSQSFLDVNRVVVVFMRFCNLLSH
jgi:hypothetical protein